MINVLKHGDGFGYWCFDGNVYGNGYLNGYGYCNGYRNKYLNGYAAGTDDYGEEDVLGDGNEYGYGTGEGDSDGVCFWRWR